MIHAIVAGIVGVIEGVTHEIRLLTVFKRRLTSRTDLSMAGFDGGIGEFSNKRIIQTASVHRRGGLLVKREEALVVHGRHSLFHVSKCVVLLEEANLPRCG